jgi:hypothetical protein
MKRRGRRKLEQPSVSFLIHLRLQEDLDQDLLQFLRTIPKRKMASAIKAALRAGGAQMTGNASDEDDEDLALAVDDFLK